MLKAIVGGQCNAEIADVVFVSQDTVKYHVKNIYTKLGVRGRVQAIRAAESLGEF